MMCLYLFYQRTELGWAFSLGMKHNLYLFIRQTSSLSLVSPPSSSLRASKTWIGACICSDIYSEILSFHHNLKFDLLDAFHLIKLYSITASRCNQYAWQLWLGSFLSISVIHSKRGSESNQKIIIHHSAWLQLISFHLNSATEQVRKKVYRPYFLALVNKSNTMLWQYKRVTWTFFSETFNWSSVMFLTLSLTLSIFVSCPTTMSLWQRSQIFFLYCWRISLLANISN